MPDLSPPDVDTSTTESAPVTPGSTPVAPAYNQPSVGTKILGFLSGGLHDTSYKVDPTTGQMGQVTDPNVRKPGDMFRSMLQGMLTGLAGGTQPGVHGGLASFAGGAQASMAQQQQMDQQKQAAAQQQFDNGQRAQTQQMKAQEFKASMIKSHDDHLASTFALARNGAEMTQQDAKDSDNLKTAIQNTPGSKYLGFHKASLDDTITALKDPTERAQWLDWKGKNQIGSHPMYELDENGTPKLLGNEFYHMEPKYDDKPTEKPVDWNHEKVDPKTGKSSFVTETIPAGQITNAEARAINTKPLTGAITPDKVFSENEEGKRADKQIAANKEIKLSEFGQQRSMEATRFANELSMAKQKGEIMDLNDPQIQKLAEGFANYQGDIKDFNRFKNAPGFRQLVMDKSGGRFNESTYEASQKALDSAAKGTGAYAPLQPSDQAIQHTAALHRLVKALPPTSNVQLLNRAMLEVARQTGNTDISNVDQLIDAVSHEAANARAKGHADVHSIAEARKNFDFSKGTKSLLSSLESSARVQHDTLNSMAGPLEREVPGIADREYAPGISNNAQDSLKYFGLDNPFNYNQGPKPAPGKNAAISQNPGVLEDFIKLAGGDPNSAKNPPEIVNKARKLAQARRWLLQ